MHGSMPRWMLRATFSSACVFIAREDHVAFEKMSQNIAPNTRQRIR